MPSFAIIGGLNFVGRHLVEYLVTNNLASDLIVLDRAIPQISHLSPEHAKVFRQVKFRQCAMMSPDDFTTALRSTVKWDYIVCTAHESRFGLSEQAYELGTVRPAVSAAHYALANGSVFIYVGNATRRQHAPGALITEEAGPPTHIRTGYKFKAIAKTEDALLAMSDLKLAILRVAEVYGNDCYVGFNMFAVARVYQALGEPFGINLQPTTRFSTIHSKDVARACFHMANYIEGHTVTYPLVYNVVDDGNTTVTKCGNIIQETFGLKINYMSKVMCKVGAWCSAFLVFWMRPMKRSCLDGWDYWKRAASTLRLWTYMYFLKC